MVEFKQRLMGDLVAVEPEVESHLRIKLPDWQRNLRGHVIAVGDDAHECKVGDYVLFGAATGMETSYRGVAIRIMHDIDVDAVLEEAHAAAS